MSNTTVYEDMVNDCLSLDSYLGSWGRQFIRTVHEVIEGGGELTDRRARALTRVWRQVMGYDPDTTPPPEQIDNESPMDIAEQVHEALLIHNRDNMEDFEDDYDLY